MATLAVAYISSISWEGSGNFTAAITYVGTLSSPSAAQGSATLSGIPANILSGLFQSAISNFVKTQLTNGFGYSFGLLDNVAVIGATL